MQVWASTRLKAMGDGCYRAREQGPGAGLQWEFAATRRRSMGLMLVWAAARQWELAAARRRSMGLMLVLATS